MASFSTYVQEKFYNELFNCAKEYLFSHLNDFSFGGRLKQVGDIGLEDIYVKHVKVDNLPGNGIRFYVSLELDVEISEGNHRYDDFREQTLWLLITCTGDIGDGIENFKLLHVEDYTGKPKQTDPMDEELVPVISHDMLDQVAEDFLKRYYPETLSEPTAVEPNKLCGRMGLTVKQARISSDGNIFGRIYFYDGTADIFDDAEEVHTVDIKAGTILVDPQAAFLYGIGAFNNTIVHECVHWALHKKAVAFARTFDKDITGIGCKIVGGTYEKKFDFIEWQANNLAPRIQLPAKMVKQYAKKSAAKIRRDTDLFDNIDVIENVIIDVATHFGVSQTAAKIRLIDLGYEEAKNAFIYVDGYYVRPHKADKISLENNQTFTLSAEDAAWLRFVSPELKTLLDEGRYIFVENHFVLNSRYYVEKKSDGGQQLTHYALNHMDECCLIIDLSIESGKVPERYHRECFLNRAFGSQIDFKPNYHGGHATKESQDKQLEDFVMRTNDFVLSLPNDYVKSLKMAIDWVGNPSHAEIENKDRDGVPHGVNRKTLERCLAGQKVDVKSMVAICISLHLPYKVSGHIISNSPSPLNPRNQADQWYDFVLETMYTSDIPEVNAFLHDHGVSEENYL